ncbi:MAG: hypothetical protein WBB39_01910 [Candidatus Saccharimonadales bacterium]
MKHTHTIIINWHTSMLIDDDDHKGFLERSINTLDGHENWCSAIWRVADPKDIDPERAKDAKNFIQAAGNNKRMAIAVTYPDPSNGCTHTQYQVGRSMKGIAGIVGKRKTTVAWNGGKTIVRRNEVFMATEALRIFEHYYHHDKVPSDCTLRYIDSISY